MKRTLTAFGAAAAAAAALACQTTASSGPLLLVVSPILDSTFVGDSLPARTVQLVDASGQAHQPASVTWSISPASVATIDPVTGVIHGVGKGAALVFATVSGATSAALVVVSRPLDVTLLMDTVYLMPNDTFTLPIAVQQKAAGARTVAFDASGAAGVYRLDDPSTGHITALAPGGPVPYSVHVQAGSDSVADTGAVVVLTLTDTTGTGGDKGGRFFSTVIGTAIRHEGGPALALNYARRNGRLAFRLSDSVTSGGVLARRTLITLPDSVIGPGTFAIDTISPQQAATTVAQLDPICQPHFSWALWRDSSTTPAITAYSHSSSGDSVAGQLVVTQYAPAAAGGGAIVSGRYLFTVRRTDLYGDPLGTLTVRGTFVAPLVTRATTCQG
jgi:hypothetical protein